MSGPHDLGGRPGFGAVAPEAEDVEPVFHHEWERRAFALTLAAGMLGLWNIDESRHARERQRPADYLAHSYYENWLAGLVRLLEEKAPASAARAPGPAEAVRLLGRGASARMPERAPPAFATGDRARVRRMEGSGHTRAPAYAQGRVGEVAACYGVYVYPDAHARGERRGEHLYSVRFDAKTLWGGADGDEVRIDLFEPYLEAAGR